MTAQLLGARAEEPPLLIPCALHCVHLWKCKVIREKSAAFHIVLANPAGTPTRWLQPARRFLPLPPSRDAWLGNAAVFPQRVTAQVSTPLEFVFECHSTALFSVTSATGSCQPKLPRNPHKSCLGSSGVCYFPFKWVLRNYLPGWIHLTTDFSTSKA